MKCKKINKCKMKIFTNSRYNLIEYIPTSYYCCCCLVSLVISKFQIELINKLQFTNYSQGRLL